VHNRAELAPRLVFTIRSGTLDAGAELGRGRLDGLRREPQLLSAVGWVLRLVAWVFAALFIAGFTTAVRKT